MTVQQLKYVLAVYQAGSISKAAQVLYVAQPNLSAAIKKLEAEIRIELFTRTSNGMTLTEAGREFVRHAARIVGDYDELEALYVAKQAPVAMLAVCTARSSEICFRMTRFVNQMNRAGTPFHIQFKATTNMEVLDRVVNGDADLGVLRTNSEDGAYFRQLIKSHKLASIPLSPARYQVLMSASHPLASKTLLTPEMLEPYTEVVHGDYETPMYPYSDYDYRGSEGLFSGKRVIFVSDRGSLMDILSNVEGSYVWTTTTNLRLKEALGLVERQCRTKAVEGVDLVIYNRSHRFTREMTEFLGYLTG